MTDFIVVRGLSVSAVLATQISELRVGLSQHQVTAQRRPHIRELRLAEINLSDLHHLVKRRDRMIELRVPGLEITSVTIVISSITTAFPVSLSTSRSSSSSAQSVKNADPTPAAAVSTIRVDDWGDIRAIMKIISVI